MGQEVSSPIGDDVPPVTLKERSVDAIASLIQDGRASKIVVMVCLPGILHSDCITNDTRPVRASVLLLVYQIFDRRTLACRFAFYRFFLISGALIHSLHISPLPLEDRSPSFDDFHRIKHTDCKTVIRYANLARLDLPYPEAVFDISYFRDNPIPFYHLAHELYPGKFRPTISHHFLRLLSDKGLLFKLFTQNIDCLERQAGVPNDKIIEAHGSFARQRCIECKASYPEDLIRNHISKREVPYCLTPECNGLVKPDIVFFGEPLPEAFHTNRLVPSTADLCIVMGTSLSVQPFASLPGFCAEGVPRLLINSERVGGLGSRADDVLLLGDCDAGVRQLATALGWHEELEELWNDNSLSGQGDTVTGREHAEAQKTKDQAIKEEIDVLTKEIDDSLRISHDRVGQIRDQLKD